MSPRFTDEELEALGGDHTSRRGPSRAVPDSPGPGSGELGEQTEDAGSALSPVSGMRSLRVRPGLGSCRDAVTVWERDAFTAKKLRKDAPVRRLRGNAN